MLSISQLLQKIPKIERTDILHAGYACWIVWGKSLPGSIPQTLSSFGGWEVCSDEGQALWFFPNRDILPAWAQISKWMRINPVVLKVAIFPCKLLIGSSLEHSLSMGDEFSGMRIESGESFQIWAHPKLKDVSAGMPGIGFEKPYSSAEAPGNSWLVFNPDEQVNYTPTLSWLFIIDPVGKKKEKEFLSKWRKYRDIFAELAQKLSIKYTSNQKYEYIFQLDNIKQLSNWIHNLMDAVSNERDSENRVPCLFVGVEKQDLVLSPSVLDRISVDWGQIEPDFIYLPLQTIYQLGSEVRPLSSRTGVEGKKITDLFQVQSTSDEDRGGRRALQVYLPAPLLSGKYNPCFYCGLKEHPPSRCPTRNLMSPQPDIWKNLEQKNLEQIAAGLEEIGRELSAGKHIGELQGAKSDSGQLAQGILEINCLSQLRMLRQVLRSRGQRWPEGLRTISDAEDAGLRTALENLRMGEHAFAAKRLKEASDRSGKNYQPRTLQGFLAMEQDRRKEALNYWVEAESLSYTPLQRGYHVFLRARLYEVGEEIETALQTYAEALKISPDMYEARYRQGVCLVKLGFPDQALGVLTAIMENNPEVFLKALIDPELGRGHLHLLSGFYDIWDQANKKATQASRTLDELQGKVDKWFDANHPARDEFNRRLKRIAELKKWNNYTAVRKLSLETVQLQKDINKRIDQGIFELKKKRDWMLKELQRVEREYSWFPFQHFFLRRTNRLFNDCALRLNNFGDLNLESPEGFRKGYIYIQEAEEIVDELSRNLVVVSKFRDILLFSFFLFKRFLLVETLTLILSVVIFPLAVFAGMKLGQEWAYSLFSQKWAAQKLGLLVLSIVSLGIAAVLTTLRFERERDKYLHRD
jgi:tetratricopeptide (TPR) repeat protein